MVDSSSVIHGRARSALAGERTTVDFDGDFDGDGEAWSQALGPLVLQDGQRVGGVMIRVDITVWKDQERLLRESEEQFRISFVNAPIWVALISSDGRFLRVNPALSGILGYEPGELLAPSIHVICHPDGAGSLLD